MNKHQHLTTSMSEAAFLMTLGHQPIEVRDADGPYTRIKTFVFDGNCAELAQSYYRGASVPARAYQAAYQEVRKLVRQATPA